MLNVVVGLLSLLVASSAFAEDGSGVRSSFYYMGYFIGVGLAAGGVAMGQGRAAGALLDGIARNPSVSNKLLVPMLLTFALMESLAIFMIFSPYLIS